MTTQPEALRLADAIEPATIHAVAFCREAAAELRRLHEENGRLRIVAEMSTLLLDQRHALLEALKQIEPILTRMYGPQAAELPPMQVVHAAIAKAEENT